MNRGVWPRVLSLPGSLRVSVRPNEAALSVPGSGYAQKTHAREEPALCREPRRAVGASPGFFITVVSPAAAREPVWSVLEDAICCARTRPRDSHLGDLGSPHPLSGGMAGVRSRWTDRGCWAVAGLTAGSLRTHRSAGGRLLCGPARQQHGCFRLYLPCAFQGSWLLSASGNSCLGAGVALAGTPWSPLV